MNEKSALIIGEAGTGEFHNVTGVFVGTDRESGLYMLATLFTSHPNAYIVEPNTFGLTPLHPVSTQKVLESGFDYVFHFEPHSYEPKLEGIS